MFGRSLSIAAVVVALLSSCGRDPLPADLETGGAAQNSPEAWSDLCDEFEVSVQGCGFGDLPGLSESCFDSVQSAYAHSEACGDRVYELYQCGVDAGCAVLDEGTCEELIPPYSLCPEF